ncbi:MAG: hypothetical protein GX868_07250 [Actinobacteria bacterium]|nr:hypothetical protein [Actinomycetota bacterium]
MRFRSVLAAGLLVVVATGCGGDDETTTPSTEVDGGVGVGGGGVGGGGAGGAPVIDWSDIGDKSIAEIADANSVAPACIAAAVTLNEVVGLMGGTEFPERIIDEARGLIPAELEQDAGSLRTLVNSLIGPDGLIDPAKAFTLRGSPEFTEVNDSITNWVSENCSNDTGS